MKLSSILPNIKQQIISQNIKKDWCTLKTFKQFAKCTKEVINGNKILKSDKVLLFSVGYFQTHKEIKFLPRHFVPKIRSCFSSGFIKYMHKMNIIKLNTHKNDT